MGRGKILRDLFWIEEIGLAAVATVACDRMGCCAVGIRMLFAATLSAVGDGKIDSICADRG